jgi:hypothetical protein
VRIDKCAAAHLIYFHLARAHLTATTSPLELLDPD